MTVDADPGTIAARLVREAMGTADVTALRMSVRYTLASLRPSERTQVVADLAVLAAGFATPWPVEDREKLLEGAEQPQHVLELLRDVYETLQRAERGGS